jgi:hypothetical protein
VKLLDRVRPKPEITEIETPEFSLAEPQRRTSAPRKRVGEMISNWNLGIRSGWRGFRTSFWPGQVAYERGAVSYAKTRTLYANTDTASSLAAFSRRIINSTVDFIGLPDASTGDLDMDEFLNKAIHEHWGREILQMVRDACRDSKTVVRYRRERPENPLVSVTEWVFGYLEIVPPENVQVYYNPINKNEIDRAYVTYTVEQIDEDISDFSNERSLRMPSVVEHTIIEEITPGDFRYFDQTAGEWRDDLASTNDWGFVPLHEVFNEYDSAMEDGQSDLENPTPFLLAFHDVLTQSLTAHKHHSIPKAKFKIHEIMTFLANNFQDSFEKDENGEPIMGTFTGSVSWKGTEIFFLEPDEDVDFLEAKSILGDSKTLLDFLLECIAITSETPKSILMNAKDQDNDEMLPFSKKIARKRINFMRDVQMVCKMALRVNGFEPVSANFTWGDVDPNQAVASAQALQQDVMSLEVARTGQVISDNTMRETLRKHLPAMQPSDIEAAAAKNNRIAPVVSPGSVSGSDSGGQGE